jgi:hypothetical protein
MRDVRDGLRKQLADADAAHQAADNACQNDMTEYAAGKSAAAANIAKMNGMASFDRSTLESRQGERANKITELGNRQAMSDSMTA